MDNSLEEKTNNIHSCGDDEVLDTINAVILKDMTPDEWQQFYDKWAATYDEDVNRIVGGFNSPHNVVHNVEKFVPDHNARILDMACGTGKVGQLLKEKGYTNVDGLDGNNAMLDIARNQKVYKNYYLEFITDSPIKTISAGSYDVVCSAASFGRGHLTAKCLKPIGLCLKPRGLLIIAMRALSLELPDFQDMEPTFEELEEAGFWKKRYRGVIEKYCGDEDGVAFVYEKL